MKHIIDIVDQYNKLEEYGTWAKGDIVSLYHRGEHLGDFATTTAAMIFAIRHSKKEEETPSILLWAEVSKAVSAIQEISRAHYNPKSLDHAITRKEAREMLRSIERVLINAKKNAKN